MGRLADVLRRRLRSAGAGAPPATLPGMESGEETAVATAAKHDSAVSEPEPEPEPAEPRPAAPGPAEPEPAAPPPDAGAQIDAARDRLRARIDPPDPDAD